MATELIIYLSGVSLVSHGPRTDHPGASGTAYPYEYNGQHRRHILYGRALSAADLSKVALDIFGAENGYRVPVPALVEAPSAPAALPEPAVSVPASTEPTPVTLETVSTAADQLPPEEQRKLGFRLVNATRPSRSRVAESIVTASA